VNFQRGKQKEPVEINLPTADADKQMERPGEVSVLVNAKGQYVINKNPVDFASIEQLAGELRRAGAGLREPIVIISADATATHQSVIRVMEAARVAGLSQITFTTQSSLPSR